MAWTVVRYLVYREWYNCLIAPIPLKPVQIFWISTGIVVKVNPYGQWEVVCTACIARLVKLHANGRIMDTYFKYLKHILN